MKRIFLSTPEDVWYDADKAMKFEEACYHDGSNWISLATSSQTEHERLYRTKSGKWVLKEWSQWQGRLETYKAISQEEAILWLLRNEHEEEAIERDTDGVVESYEI